MGIIKSLFGSKGSKQKSESGNLAYDYLKGAYSPMVSGGTGAFGQLGSALGVGGNFAGQQQAYDNFLNNSGYQYVLDQGMQGVTNSAAGNYLLRSGATAKALQDRAMNIGKTYFENYLDHLGDMSKLGLGAGSLISGAGQYSKGSGTSGGDSGVGNAIGTALTIASLFSEPELKKNIEHVGYTPDGIEIVDFDYRQDTPLKLPEGRFRGVMADEVERLRPDALGPTINGYRTVNYSRLEQ